MAGVDNRIVTMQFDNRSFEQNAKTSLTTLQKLKESMDFGKIVGGTVRGLGHIEGALSKLGLKTPFAPLIRGANTGLGMIGNTLDRLGLKNPFSTGIQSASEMQRAAQAAGGPQGMGVLEGGVTAVSNKFIALSTIAITALSNITNRAINAGTAFAKSFTVAPILDGLHEYETNLKAIQTVQANTDRPLPEINDALDRLNEYSDQTIYNFGEMAKNVGTFTAAGVDLETSVSSIKGIANLAALSGSSSEQAASAMYQLSQAIAAGKVGLMDWNSVVNAGMGGKKLQNALAQTAVAMGRIEPSDTAIDKMGKLTVQGQSFRESIMAKPGQESWLDSDILVNTLSVMDGRFSKAALAAEENAKGLQKYTNAQIEAKIATARTALEQKNGVKFTDEQFEALQKMSNQAFESAQKVKTLGQVFDIAKEQIGSGWSASFRNIFGNLNQAKKLFTGMSEGLGDIIKGNARARNELLSAWSESKVGGRADLITALGDAWKAVLRILGPIKRGFRDIFPAKTVDDLRSMTTSFGDFTKSLIPSKDTMADIRDIAGGVFAVFGIGKTLLGGVVTMFKTLFSAVGGGNGNFLDFAAGVGNAVKSFNDFLKESGVVTEFFQGLGGILSAPLAILQGIAGMFGRVFDGFDSATAGKFGDAVDGASEKLSGLEAVGERIRSFFGKIGDFFSNIGERIGQALVGIGDMVAGAFTADTFNGALDVINTTLLGGIVLLLKSFFTKGVKLDFTGGLFDGIKETLGAATSAFENMQMKLKADILMKLAIAIGAMAAALFVLSTIDPGAMAKALTAMSLGFGILIGALAALMKFLGAAGLVQMYVVTSAMTKMAFSILILATALKILAGISFGDMLRGLVGLAAMMFILTKAMIPLAAGSKGMGRASASIILLGIGINLLAIALKIFATMSWEEMIRGLAGLVGVLGALVVAFKLMPPLQAEAIGLIALGVAMNLLAVALKIFATMSWEEMAKGLVVLALSLNIIAAAVKLMPKTMMLQAVALVAVAGAMVILSGALKVMGSMGWEEIAKGLIVLGGAMVLIAIGLQAIGIVGTIGAVGLLITAAALSVLLPVMLAFGAMDWMTILKSLTMLAGIFVILGVAAYAIGPMVVVLVALGAALLLMGAGLALAGAGALLAATAFGIVVAAGVAGAQVLAMVLKTIIDAIPPALKAFGQGVVQFAVAIGQGAPRIANAFGRVLGNLINQVTKNTPKLGRMFNVMIGTALNVINKNIPKIINTGFRLIISFLEAVDRHIPRIVDLASDIIVKFLNGLGRNMPRIVDAGFRMIIKFIDGITRAINNNSEEMGRAGGDLAVALVNGVVNGLKAGAGRIKDAAMDAAKGAWESAKNFFGIGSPLMRDTVGIPFSTGIAIGIEKGAPRATREVETMGKTLVSTMSRVMRGVDEAFALDPNLNPVISPVLDLTALTQEANKMSSILATAPIMPTVSYQTAADISTLTQPSDDGEDGPGGTGGSGDQYNELNLHLHSPRPIDSVESYRAGKTLIAIAKETLK